MRKLPATTTDVYPSISAGSSFAERFTIAARCGYAWMPPHATELRRARIGEEDVRAVLGLHTSGIATGESKRGRHRKVFRDVHRCRSARSVQSPEPQAKTKTRDYPDSA